MNEARMHHIDRIIAVEGRIERAIAATEKARDELAPSVWGGNVFETCVQELGAPRLDDSLDSLRAALEGIRGAIAWLKAEAEVEDDDIEDVVEA